MEAHHFAILHDYEIVEVITEIREDTGKESTASGKTCLLDATFSTVEPYVFFA